MLYYLFRFLEQFGVPGSGMWSYISFRSLLALMLALVVSAWFGEYFIKWMKRRHIGETARDPKIDPFGEKKVGVPSMGGIIIIVSILIPVLLLGRLRNIYMILMIASTIWFGLLGFADDYIKIFRKNKEGLAGRYKIIGQVLAGLAVGLTLYLSPDVVMRENVTTRSLGGGVATAVVHKSEPVKSTKTTIPFVKNHNLDYASPFKFLGNHKQAAGWILFVLMTIVVITSVSNGANLNDGMDGMAAGNSAIICIALGILAYVSGHLYWAGYLNIMFIPGSEELVVFICAMIGALVGFLWYNAYPAQVFMGDTGSLCIGGLIGVIAVIIHKELLLPVLCFIFFVESLSVILQVEYFKWGKKRGRRQRIFKRTPIHDNFRVLPHQMEEGCHYVFGRWPHGAWHESKITVRFWITTILLAAATIITLKIR
ncbi:MAG: phospho-N-acetylmuramoyl-pentapeptide-transferase [Alloprevotella sp.]|nr:phospho-N-acetylmuramoyl-pentapeptide-transferase [Alloprevotella sp.]